MNARERHILQMKSIETQMNMIKNKTSPHYHDLKRKYNAMKKELFIYDKYRKEYYDNTAKRKEWTR